MDENYNECEGSRTNREATDHQLCSFQNITKLDQIGGNVFIQVFKCQINDNPTIYATKIRKFCMDKMKQCYEESVKEYTIGKDLSHPNIVKYEYLIKEIQ